MAENVSIEVQVNSSPAITVSNVDAATISVGDASAPAITVGNPDSSSIAVSSPSSASVSVVQPEGSSIDVLGTQSPSIEVSDSSSSSSKLVDLTDVTGSPDDGDTVVFDEDLNAFVFQAAGTGVGGGSGSLTQDLIVTNTSNVFADSNGSSYESGDSLEDIIRDFLAPNDAGIDFYDLEIASGNGALTGEYIVWGTSWSVNKLVVRLTRNQTIPSGARVQLFINGAMKSQSPPYADWSDHDEVTLTSGSVAWTEIPEYLEVRIPKSSEGYMSKRIYPKKIYPVAMYVSPVSDAYAIGTSQAVETLRGTLGFDYDGGHEEKSKSALLRGTEHSESSDNFVYIAVPSEYNLEAIAEVSSGVGVADMSNSFSRVSDETFATYHTFSGVDQYDVYLYRSNQTGALKSTSYLRVKVE